MSTTGSTSVITSSPNALLINYSNSHCCSAAPHLSHIQRFMDPLLKKEAAPLKVYCTLEDFLPVNMGQKPCYTTCYYSTEDRSWTTMSGCPDFTKPWSPGLEDECMAFLNNIVLKVYSALPSRATASLRWWIAANSIRSVEDGGGKWRPDLVLMSASSDNPTNPKALPPAKWRSVHALAELKDREKNSVPLHEQIFQLMGLYVELDAPYMCPAGCGRSFATAHAVNTHLGSAKKCLWYHKGKSRSLAIPQPQEDNGEEASGLDMLIDDEHMEEAIGEVLQELQEDLFSFIPIAHSDIIDDGENAAGPSLHQNSIVLDDNEDECMEVEHPTAGKVISMDETLHQRWRRESIAAGRDGQDVEMGEASDPKFFSFASETDWRVACWAIQDGIGHQSFNWLLSIPGVREKLGLSYLNIRRLHKIVDYSIPFRAE
ncbi:hypothetical protein SERLADRAFT_409690 [Serpula lacrymans var. lacrymans S7.9]|uniref:C2H2-type domain-containing protein n=1 Tax=Serpula lacrymans var. lacrymans (strain S7.9) TaxID=578457 RepID=F8P2F6_SERL9|nr:uncharacterized protein SERLADRAFT_409690 [Serpula lacrymans var. lacrymans S7.9]EGO23334.1 hypothetical protein SERLADRAFT_409690 [Serpula lacrymans var. lacrymans S7.9]